MREQVYGLRPGIRLLVPAPLYHAAPNVFAMRGIQVADAVILMPKIDAELLLQLIEQHRVTSIVMVPTMFVRLLRLPAEVLTVTISSLLSVHHAGSALSADIKRAMIEWFGPIIHDGRHHRIQRGDRLQQRGVAGPSGTVGRAIEGARIEIVDDHGAIVPPGQPGELYVGIHRSGTSLTTSAMTTAARLAAERPDHRRRRRLSRRGRLPFSVRSGKRTW